MSDLRFPTSDAERVVDIALTEDLGPQGVDVTTFATIPRAQQAVGHVVARADGVVAGLPVVEIVVAAVAKRLDLSASVTVLVEDGARVERGDRLARIEGAAQVVLVAERTLLNIVSRASGVATHTRRWADELAGTPCLVLDTRKTTPGLRALEKYAVRAGGGTNKRMGLYDCAMIKDNHKLAAGGLTPAIAAVRAAYPDVPVQVEVTTTAEALEVLDTGVRFLMCDNMSVPLLTETVRAARAHVPDPVEIEATGGLSLEVAAAYAATGVDYLSVGGLTHSSPILDIALDLDE